MGDSYMTSSELRAVARQNLEGTWGISVGVALVASLLGGSMAGAGSNVNFNVSEENIRNNYPWAVTMLPCKPLTKKQKEMMRHINDYLRDVDDNDTISIEYFVAALMEENENLTAKRIEGVLSSLWVKGYIRCNVLAGDRKSVV